MGLPPILGFILLRGVLSYAVLLHSTTRLNDELSIRVCEEAHEVIKATKMVGIHSSSIINKLLHEYSYYTCYTCLSNSLCIYIMLRHTYTTMYYTHPT